MKLIIQNYRVVGTATDEYPGPEKCMDAPDWFSIDRMGEYRVDLVLVDPNPPVVATPVVETPVVETPTEPVVEAPAETPTDGAI